MTAWTISTLAKGAAVTLFAQLSPTERVGFECSFVSFIVLAQAERFKDAPPSSEIVLNLAGARFRSNTTYLLGANPPFWSGSFVEEGEILSVLRASKHMVVSISDQVLKVDLDTKQVANFVDRCPKQIEAVQ